MLAMIMKNGQSTINECIAAKSLNGILDEGNEEIAIDVSDYIVDYFQNRNKKCLLMYIRKYFDEAKVRECINQAYVFKCDDYETPIYSGANEWLFKYETQQEAMQEGLEEFRKLIYSKRESIIESILAQYKHRCMRSYLYYDEVKGNLYFDINQGIKKTLTSMKLHIKNITEGKVILGENFNEFFVKPNFEEGECSGIKKLRNLEHSDFKQQILNGLEDVTWYDVFIDVAQDRDTGLYCYGNLNKVCRYFGNHIIQEIDKALNDTMHGVGDLLMETFDKFNEDIRNELEVKFNIIDKHLS